jgi:hypothetical protein
MKRFICLLVVLAIGALFFWGLASAEEDKPNIEIKPMYPEHLTIDPGKVVTVSLVVVNHTNSEIDFLEELKLPSDWQVIIPAAPFRLNAYDQQVRLISLFVPANCAAGAYQVGYSIASQDPQRYTYTATINVSVSTVSTIKSFLEEKPQTVIAGEQYTVKLRYLNQGNSQVGLAFTVTSTPDYRLEFVPAEMSLRPSESQILTIMVQTDPKLVTGIKHVLNVKAIDKKTLLTYSNNTILSDIIPRIAGDYGFYHRIPSQLKIISGWEREANPDATNPGLQMEFTGSGSIDEYGKEQVRWHFLTPNVIGPDFNQNIPNYQFSFSNDWLDLDAGDRSMALSPLTKRWGEEDNFRLNFHAGNSSFGVINPDKNERGIYYGYQLNPWFGMRMNYLDSVDRLSDQEMYSVQAELKPLTNTSLNLEYGRDGEADDDSSAYRINWRGYSRNSFSYSLENIHAAPDFFGNYNDLDSTNGIISFLLGKKLQASLFYHTFRNNLELDPSQATAHDETAFNANFSYNVSRKTLLLFSMRDFQRKDRLWPSEYDNEQQSARIGWQHQFSKWRVLAYVGGGAYQDKLGDDEPIDFTTYSLNLNYAPTANQTYLLYANLGDKNYNLIPDVNNTIGAAARLRFMKNYDFGLEYQKRNFYEDLAAGQDYLSFDLSYTLAPFSIKLKGYQISDADFSDFNGSFLVTYTLPYNIPVSKRTELSAIKGRVFNAEMPGDMPISNVIIKANGIIAATNELGEFIIASPPPGLYSITIDKSRIGLDLVTVERLPLVVEVKKGETTAVKIGMVSAAKIAGKAVLAAADPQDAANGLFATGRGQDSPAVQANRDEPSLRALANALIEFSDGQETFRQVTNGNGEFSFEGMRPGRWSLKAYNDSLPAHYYFETAQLELDLKPGEVKEIVFKAIPQIRTIQIVEEGEIGPPVAAPGTPPGPDSLPGAEHYSSAEAARSSRASLEKTGLLPKKYLYHDQFFTDIIYIVKPGETLFYIADKFQVPLQRLIDLNYLGATGTVKANSVLIIPVPVEFIHTVKPDETLETIAKKYGTTVAVLADLNGLGANQQPEAGQTLVLPGR